VVFVVRTTRTGDWGAAWLALTVWGLTVADHGSSGEKRGFWCVDVAPVVKDGPSLSISSMLISRN